MKGFINSLEAIFLPYLNLCSRDIQVILPCKPCSVESAYVKTIQASSLTPAKGLCVGIGGEKITGHIESITCIVFDTYALSTFWHWGMSAHYHAAA